MTKKALEKKIIELLPSETLKDYLKTNDFHFQERDLLKFIVDYSRTFSQKIKLLEEASIALQDKENQNHAKKLVKFHQKKYDDFMRPSDDTVYEILIKCHPDDAPEENYIVKTFDDALALIRNYWKYYAEYDATDNELSEYIINKKTCFPPKKPSDLNHKVGELGYCELGYKLVIKDVDMYARDTEFGKCSMICYENCKTHCLFNHDVEYPPFLKKYELVAFQADWAQSLILYKDQRISFDNMDKHIRYGILVSDLNQHSIDSEVVFLDNPYIKNRDAFSKHEDGYYNIYTYHDHPAYATLYRPNIDMVDKNIIEDYYYAAEALKEIDNSFKE
ncbi:MAG: hypothetical protein K2J93_04735 [Anaeroplasmataceae bacterium]|nr:hypothetical protein [Anaeroplasmataceae bacterium]